MLETLLRQSSSCYEDVFPPLQDTVVARTTSLPPSSAPPRLSLAQDASRSLTETGGRPGYGGRAGLRAADNRGDAQRLWRRLRWDSSIKKTGFCKPEWCNLTHSSPAQGQGDAQRLWRRLRWDSSINSRVLDTAYFEKAKIAAEICGTAHRLWPRVESPALSAKGTVFQQLVAFQQFGLTSWAQALVNANDAPLQLRGQRDRRPAPQHCRLHVSQDCQYHSTNQSSSLLQGPAAARGDRRPTPQQRRPVVGGDPGGRCDRAVTLQTVGGSRQ